MGDYARIERRVWNSSTFGTLSEDAQRLWLYLLTCPHGKILGLFVLKWGYVLEDMSNSTSKPWTRQRLEKALQQLLTVPLSQDQPRGLIKHDRGAQLIFIRNYLHPEHNPIQNPNQMTAALALVDVLPVSPLFLDVADTLERLGQPFTKPLQERLRERLGQPVAVAVAVAVAVDSGSDLGSLEDSGTSSLPIALNDALRQATLLRPIPKADFFLSLLQTYSEEELTREIGKCHLWLIGHADRKPRSARGCAARITNWLLNAEKYGDLPGAAPTGRVGPSTEQTNKLLAEMEEHEREVNAQTPEERAEVKRLTDETIAKLGAAE